MTTEITAFEAAQFAYDFTGPLGEYFGRLNDYFQAEPAAYSVNVEFSALPGFHKSWLSAVEAARIRFQESQDAILVEAYLAEQRELAANPELAARL